MPPVHTHLLGKMLFGAITFQVSQRHLKCLPESGSRKGLDTSAEPDVVEHPKHPVTKLVSRIVLDGRRGKQGVVDGQQEGEERVPGLPLHSLTLLGQLLHSPATKVYIFN